MITAYIVIISIIEISNANINSQILIAMNFNLKYIYINEIIIYN